MLLAQRRIFSSASAVDASTLARLIQALDLGILLVDSRGVVAIANPAMAMMVGLTVEKLVGMGSHELGLHVAAMVDDPTQRGKVGELLCRRLSADCEEIRLSSPSPSVTRWVAQPLPVRGGTGVLVTCVDITAEVELAAASERTATHDSLTGLVNRRGGQLVLNREVARVRRIRSPLGLVIADIDHFKRINDRYGHAVGDQVLRKVGQTIQASLRETDFAVRWGGEEFLFILPDTELEGVRLCAERIRAAMSRERIEPVGAVTLSAGASTFAAGDESIEQALARADGQLYRAKAEGRNCVH